MLRPNHLLTTLACCGLLLPTPTIALAEGPPLRGPLPQLSRANAIEDIALAANQSLHGVAIRENGEPAAKRPVVVTQLGKEVGRTSTDDNGRFVVQGLKSGVYQLTADENAAMVRLWAEGTAPPNARPAVTVVNRLTVRGQRPMSELFSSPGFVIGALVVGAVAIPVAIHNSRDDKKSGS